MLWPLCFSFESAAVLILGSVLGLLPGRKLMHGLSKVGVGDLDVSTLTLGPSSPHTKGQFSE